MLGNSFLQISMALKAIKVTHKQVTAKAALLLKKFFNLIFGFTLLPCSQKSTPFRTSHTEDRTSRIEESHLFPLLKIDVK